MGAEGVGVSLDEPWQDHVVGEAIVDGHVGVAAQLLHRADGQDAVPADGDTSRRRSTPVHGPHPSCRVDDGVGHGWISAIDASHAEGSCSVIQAFLWHAIHQWLDTSAAAIGVDELEDLPTLLGSATVVGLASGKVAADAGHLRPVPLADHGEEGTEQAVPTAKHDRDERPGRSLLAWQCGYSAARALVTAPWSQSASLETGTSRGI